MPGPDIQTGWPIPLVRLPPWFPGQYGVPYTDSEEGMRTDPAGAVFYVDPNHSGRNDGRDGTDPQAPLATVQAGIDRCEHYHNDVVMVAANNVSGTVRNLPIAENVVLNKGGVRLVGCAMGARGVYWVPTSGVALTMTAPDCIVEGFYYNAATGVKMLYDNTQAAWAYNCTLRHNYFADCDMGIHLTDAHYSFIHGCWFDMCDYGVFSSLQLGDHPWDFQIFDNFFDVCERAIFCRNATYFNIHHNRIMCRGGPPGGVNTGICLQDGGQNIVTENVLPCTVGANYDGVNTGGAGDIWANNFCADGVCSGAPA